MGYYRCTFLYMCTNKNTIEIIHMSGFFFCLVVILKQTRTRAAPIAQNIFFFSNTLLGLLLNPAFC